MPGTGSGVHIKCLTSTKNRDETLNFNVEAEVISNAL
jgi:hypothetical protein